MNPIRIVHFADLHYSEENQKAALESLDCLIAYCRQSPPMVIVDAGDTFHRGVQNSHKGGLPRLVGAFRELLEVAPIVAVEGTPTHDIPGCYSVLEQLNAPHPFILLNGALPWYGTYDGIFDARPEGESLLIAGCCEPSKRWLLADPNVMDAEASLSEALRKIFLGIGTFNIDKGKPRLPMLMVYHGQVAGARLSQEQLLRPGGIQVGREDLELVGADYTALGDIHLGQQIGDTEMYYSGSCFPTNWGETDQKNFNVVTIDGRGTTVELIPFPHSPRQKITAGHGFILKEMSLEGLQTWLEIEDTKPALAGVSPAEILGDMIEQGALVGSRVTLSVLPTETVRAGEITKVKSIADKLRVYFENSGRENLCTISLCEKAAKLEEDRRQEGFSDEGCSIRIQQLKLRGAIGIQRGQEMAEIELDLNSYDEGLVALVGANGEGKTTLIENMHPYSQMLTRSGKLQDHFYLRDSYRDLTFIEERSGAVYRSLMIIDGANRSGSVEYWLYRNGEPIVNGRKADYDEQIEKLFGPLSLYLRSAFVTQRPTKSNPELWDATQGEKKALFSELVGIDYLQAYSLQARESAKALESTIDRQCGKRDAIAESLEEEDEEDLKKQEARVAGGMIDLSIQIEKAEENIKRGKEAYAAVREKVEEQKRLAEKIADARCSQAQYATRLQRWDREKRLQGGFIVSERLAAGEIKKYESMSAKMSILNGEYQDYLEAQNVSVSAYHDRTKGYQLLKDEKERELSKKKEEKQGIALQRVALDNRKEKLTASVEIALNENCPTCGQLLPADQLKRLRDEQDHDREHLKSVLDMIRENSEAGADVENDILRFREAIKDLPVPLPPKEKPFPELQLLLSLRAEIDECDIENARDVVAKAATARAVIDGLKKQIDETTKEDDRVRAEIEELSSRLDQRSAERLLDIETSLESADKARDDLVRRIADCDASIDVLKRRIQENAGRQELFDGVVKEIERDTENSTEWRTLETACGPNGIQALELDALAPAISQVANRLLSAAYGSRFTVEFKTTRSGGAGSKVHQIEDFQIMVRTGVMEEQNLDSLSGGESVWVRRAIYDAFAIVRDRNTGMKFLTAFQDEADGALDEESKRAYFEILEAAHIESGRVHTIVITHSDVIQQMIPQRIVISELPMK